MFVPLRASTVRRLDGLAAALERERRRGRPRRAGSARARRGRRGDGTRSSIGATASMRLEARPARRTSLGNGCSLSGGGGGGGGGAPVASVTVTVPVIDAVQPADERVGARGREGVRHRRAGDADRALRGPSWRCRSARCARPSCPRRTMSPVSPTLTVTALGVQRLSLPSGSTPSTAWTVCSADAGGREGERGDAATRGERPLHETTSICSIIALSACSSAWQWKTYLPA